MKRQLLIAVIFVCISEITFSQVKTLTNVRPASPAAQLGWDNSGTSGDLQIRNDFSSQPIDFYLATTKYLSLTSNGDLDLVSSSKAYKIGGSNVLRIQNSGTTTVLGVGAGNTGAASIHSAGILVL